MEHVERAHPFRVTLCEVVVHGHHVHTVAAKCVEEHRERTHEGFTFTGSHFGNLTLVKHDTTDELHVVVNHIPSHLVATSHPVVVVSGFVALDGEEVATFSRQFAVEVGSGHLDGFILCETASGIFHDGEHFRKHFVELSLNAVEHFFLQFVDLVPKWLTLFKVKFFYFYLDFCDFVAEWLHIVLNLLTDCSDTRTEFIVRQSFHSWIHLLDFLQDRAQFLQVTVALAAEHRF